MRKRSFGLEKEISRYNAVISCFSALDKGVGYLNLQDGISREILTGAFRESDIFLPDGHHYSAVGNSLIAELIFQRAVQFFSEVGSIYDMGCH
jgi:hypothetical protein